MPKFNSLWVEVRDLYLPIRGSTTRFDRVERPVIVCLCGSTRFYAAFQEANYAETMAGRIVLSVGHYPHSPQQAHGESVSWVKQKLALDELHKRKIDLADEVLVLNVAGYVGESTRSEVLHADRTGKTVRWLEPDSVPADLAHIGDSTTTRRGAVPAA